MLTTQCAPLPSPFVHEGSTCQPVSELTVRTLRANLSVAGASSADLNNVTVTPVALPGSANVTVTPVALPGSAAGLSVGAWVGIGFGAFGVGSLLGIGFLLCHHYCRRNAGQQRATSESNDDL